MGILARFSDIMRSNINALLDKYEDPAKMVDQTLLDLREDLAEVKKETAGVIADEKNAQRRLEDCQNEIRRYSTAAQNALKSGNETDARTLIARKQQLEETLTSLQQNYDLAHDNSEKMRAMHTKLVSDIEALEARRDTIKAKVATAKAQSRVNKVLSGTDTSASFDAFRRMEDKANRMIDAASAEAELNADRHSTDDLASRYTTGSSASVDDELARMKKELGL